MIVDAKGRIFGKVNIVDLTILAICILTTFIALKFIFFEPNYFHYKNLIVEVKFRAIPLNDLASFSIGKNSFSQDNASYLIIIENESVKCDHKKKQMVIVYYFNKSYSILAGYSYDQKNISLIYCDNCQSQLQNKTKLVNCEYECKSVSEVDYFDGLPVDMSDYVCSPKLTFNLKARIIDDQPLYNGYSILKGGFFVAESIKGNVMDRGTIVSVYEKI